MGPTGRSVDADTEEPAGDGSWHFARQLHQRGVASDRHWDTDCCEAAGKSSRRNWLPWPRTGEEPGVVAGVDRGGGEDVFDQSIYEVAEPGRHTDWFAAEEQFDAASVCVTCLRVSWVIRVMRWA
jgi:hypothetical protein